MGKERSEREAFVVRIWWEGKAWRGWIHHVRSGANRYFLNLGEMNRFMERHAIQREGEGGEVRQGKRERRSRS